MIASNGRPTSAGRRRALSLGVKLGGGFAVLTVLSVMLGLFSLERLGRTNSAVVVIRDHYLPSTLAAAGLELALQDVHCSETQMMTAASDAQRAAVTASLRSAIAALSQRRASYDHAIDPGGERQRFAAAFDIIWPRYRADIAAEQKSKQNEQDGDAHDYFMTMSAAHFNALLDLLQWDLKYNEPRGQAYGELSRRSYATARVFIGAGIALVLLLSVATALVLIRHISRPVAVMTNAMRRLADHDLLVAATRSGRWRRRCRCSRTGWRRRTGCRRSRRPSARCGRGAAPGWKRWCRSSSGRSAAPSPRWPRRRRRWRGPPRR